MTDTNAPSLPTRARVVVIGGGVIGTSVAYHLGHLGWTDTVQQSLKALEEFSSEYGALPDLIKADNLMMRKDGTLVFSDPVFME